MEVYRNRLILYGCGDFLNDYEGIEGYEEFRGDLALMYFADVDSGERRPPGARNDAAANQAVSARAGVARGRRVARRTLDRESAGFGARVSVKPEGTLALSWRTLGRPDGRPSDALALRWRSIAEGVAPRLSSNRPRTTAPHGRVTDFERAWFGKEMRGARDDLDRLGPTQPRQASSFSSITPKSAPPTIRSVGVCSPSRAEPARIRPAAAGDDRADPILEPRRGDQRRRGPVLAPKRPSGSRRNCGSRSIHSTACARRSARSAMSKTLARSASSSSVSRSNSRVAMACSLSASATARLRGLKRLDPLP